jgi:hypothetical protein
MNLLKSLWLSNSRKVAFGLLLFLVSTGLLAVKLILTADWMNCVFLASALIGGGTLGDAYISSKAKASEPKSN